MSVWLRLCLVALGFAAITSGCSGKSHPSSGTAASSPIAGSPAVDATPRPSGVPADATPIAASRTFAGPAGAQPPHLYAMDCKDGVLRIVTSQTLQMYAELPCDRAVPANVANQFIGAPVQLRVEFGNATKIYVARPGGASIEYTVGRVWVKG